MKELKETIDLMTSENYDERLVAEYWQTKIRLKKLDAFIGHYHRGELAFAPSCPVELLEDQADAMSRYLALLLKRVEIEGVDLTREWMEETQTNKDTRYQAVYWFKDINGNQGLGNLDIAVKAPPTSGEAIREIERSVREHFTFDNLVLLNLIPLEG